MISMRDPEVYDVREAQSISADGAGPILGPALSLDVDRLGVHAVLLAEVEGQGRFVGAVRAALPGGSEAPEFESVMNAMIESLHAQTGLRLVTEDANASDDLLVALTGYPAEPLRVAVLPAGSHAVFQPLVNAVRATPSILEVIYDTVLTDQGAVSGAMLEAELRSFQPDMVVLIAGDAVQSEWSTMVGTLGPLLKGGVVGQAVVLASEDHQQQVIQMVGEDTSLMGLDPSEYDVQEVAGAVEIELQGLYDTRVASMDFSAIPAVPGYVNRARALDIVTRFLARRAERSVLTLSIEDGTSLAWAGGDASIMVTRPEVDVTSHVRGLMSQDLDAIAGRIPFSVRPDDLRNWIMNRSVRPEARPSIARDMAIEAALAYAAICEALRDVPILESRAIDLIIGGPMFARWGSSAVGVLSLLDGIQPRPAGGIVDIIIDGEGVAAACGAIGELTPAMAADTVEHDLAHPTATVVILDGSGSIGDLAVRGELVTDSGEATSFSVPYGSIHRLPLAEGEEARLELVPEDSFAVYGSPAGERVILEGDQAMRGSELGILIDARGIERAGATSSEQMATWLADLGYEGDY